MKTTITITTSPVAKKRKRKSSTKNEDTENHSNHLRKRNHDLNDSFVKKEDIIKQEHSIKKEQEYTSVTDMVSPTNMMAVTNMIAAKNMMESPTIYPHACDVCHRRFKNRGNLIQHHRIHEPDPKQRHRRFHPPVQSFNSHQVNQAETAALQAKNQMLVSFLGMYAGSEALRNMKAEAYDFDPRQNNLVERSTRIGESSKNKEKSVTTEIRSSRRKPAKTFKCLKVEGDKYRYRVLQDDTSNPKENNGALNLCVRNGASEKMSNFSRSKNDIFTCTICQLDFGTENSYNEHVALHCTGQNGSRDLDSAMEWQVIGDTAVLKSKKLPSECSQSSKDNLMCEFCMLRFPGQYELHQHYVLYHNNSKQHRYDNFECEWCHKLYSTREQLLIHVQIHTGEFLLPIQIIRTISLLI